MASPPEIHFAVPYRPPPVQAPTKAATTATALPTTTTTAAATVIAPFEHATLTPAMLCTGRRR